MKHTQIRLGVAYHNLAETYMLLGAYEQAGEHIMKSLGISQQQSRRMNEAINVPVNRQARAACPRIGLNHNYFPVH